MATYGFTVNVDGNASEMMKKIETSLESMGAKAKIESKEVNTAFDSMHSKIKSTFSNIKSLLIGGLGISAAFAGFSFVKDSVEAFNNAADANAKLNAVLASTKGVAGHTFEDLTKSAKELSSQTLFSGSQIKDAQSMLLTFTGIKGAIFDKTIPAIENFATRFKMELPEAANTLGKALNDPATGMTKLQRQGVVFTEQQKDQIQKMTEAGNVAGAQTIILKELENEFGGLAQAMTKTPQGQAIMAKKQWGEFKLAIGEFVTTIQTKLIPVFTKIMSSLKDMFHWLKDSSTSAIIFKDVLLTVGSALLIYESYVTIAAAATKIWAGIQAILNASMWAMPITWIVGGIVALAAGIAIAWDKCEGFRMAIMSLWEVVKKAVTGMIDYFVNLGKIIFDAMKIVFDPVHAKKHFEELKKAGNDFIKDFKNDFTKGWSEAWEKGAQTGKNSKFRFGNLLSFGTGQAGQSAGFGAGSKTGSALTDNAIKTSDLAGAKGGLGEAKVINIKIDTLQKISTITGVNDFKGASQDAIEVLIRALNNLSYSQSGTM